MTMGYGADSVNEILNTYLDASKTPQHLPGLAAVNRGKDGFQAVYPSGPKQGQPWNPGHVLITVETGTVRITADGSAPNENFGMLYGVGTPNGPICDWTDALRDYQGMIKNCQVVVIGAGSVARLNLSFRN